MWKAIIILLQCNVLGNLASWQSCGWHLTHTIRLNTNAGQVHLLMATAFCDVSTMHSDKQHKLLRNSLRNTTKSPRCWSGLQSPQIRTQSSIYRMCWKKYNPWKPNPPTYRTQRIHYQHPGARHHRTPPEVLRPCIDRSDLLYLYRGNLHNSRSLFFMFWLICVCSSKSTFVVLRCSISV